MEKSTSDRLIWVDFIRIVSAFLVIGIHVADVYSVPTPDRVGNVNWLITNFYDNFLRCAVPFFIMISGYLLLHKKQPLEKSMFTRIWRILVSLVAWSVIYLLVRKIYIGSTLDEQPITIFTGIQCLLQGKVCVHLWFLYMIVSLYLVAPILQSYLQSASQQNIRYLIRFWWFGALIWPILSLIVTKSFEIQRINFDIYIVAGCVGYFVAGYYYGDKVISGKICTFFALLLVILSVAATVTVFCMGDRGFSRLYLYYLLEPVFTILFFMVLKYLGSRPWLTVSFVAPFLQRIAALTFGIYLVHILVLRVLSDGILGFSLSLTSFTPLLSLPAVSLVIFMLSGIVIFAGQKIPILRQIFL